MGNWKAILNDPNLKFDNRSPVDLKDRYVAYNNNDVSILTRRRFRTFFPDAYKIHYPNAKTHLSSKIRSTLPDGSSIFEKTRSKKRRPFTAEEDRALKAGYERYGTVWSTIVKDPVFQEQGRRSTDLRDRFRNAFPDLYQAAGYKPRSQPKKKRGDASICAPRQAADDQLLPSRMATPASRRRSRTTSGYSYSVPQSAACSEDEDSSDEEDVMESKKSTFGYSIKEMTPQPEGPQYPLESMLDEASLHTIEQNDPLDMSLTELFPDTTQTPSDSIEQSAWSSDRPSPPHADSWSSTATTTTASPTSSQISIGDYFFNSPFEAFRGDGANMIGNSAWAQSDWLSGNSRLDPNGAAMSSGSPFAGGPSPTPSSPFSFSHLSHGIMDRLDLIENLGAHDFASEVGVSDAYSTFSDPELLPTQSMRGFTHHSNYAGDLIFGNRSHQPLMPMGTFTGMGLGLSGVQQEPSAINPMHLHTPGLQDIDELGAINLNDDEPMLSVSPPAANAYLPKHEAPNTLRYDVQDLSSIIHLPPQTLEEIAGLSLDASGNMDSAATPPATPSHMGRTARELHSSTSSTSLHNRSMSVPPFERVATRPVLPQGHATPQPGPTRSLSSFEMPTLSTDPNAFSPVSMHPGPSHSNTVMANSFLNTNLFADSFKSLDLSDLCFLDLHAPNQDISHHDIIEGGPGETRNGLALDLAQTQAAAAVSGLHFGPTPQAQPFVHTTMRTATPPLTVDQLGRSQHQRVQSQMVVAPKDLLLSYDGRHKRMSWDGSAV